MLEEQHQSFKGARQMAGKPVHWQQALTLAPTYLTKSIFRPSLFYLCPFVLRLDVWRPTVLGVRVQFIEKRLIGNRHPPSHQPTKPRALRLSLFYLRPFMLSLAVWRPTVLGGRVSDCSL